MSSLTRRASSQRPSPPRKFRLPTLPCAASVAGSGDGPQAHICLRQVPQERRDSRSRSKQGLLAIPEARQDHGQGTSDADASGTSRRSDFISGARPV
eukprot:1065866-Alexandrium_andersonii.AAC.1